MAIREIVRMGDPRLLRRAEPVAAFGTPELLSLIDDMVDTMKSADGAGLAAPQIGVNLRVVIFGTGEPIARYPSSSSASAAMTAIPMRRRYHAPSSSTR